MHPNEHAVLMVYQKHEQLKAAGICCTDERPCDKVVLFNEIRRLNGEIAMRNAAIAIRDLMVELDNTCPHGHAGCCGHHDLEDMPIHESGCPEATI